MSEKNSNESPRTEVCLFEKENSVIQGMTSEDIKLLLSLRKDNLVKDRANIVGIRSEDLIHFCECIRLGYIPVGASPFRGKADSTAYLFITPNPESLYLRDRAPEFLKGAKGLDFRSCALGNIELYARIAGQQALRREVLSDLDEADLIKRELARTKGEERDEDFSTEVATENFYDDLWDYVREKKTNFAVRDLLSEMREKPQVMNRFKKMKSLLEQRGGIILAFNKPVPK